MKASLHTDLHGERARESTKQSVENLYRKYGSDLDMLQELLEIRNWLEHSNMPNKENYFSFLKENGTFQYKDSNPQVTLNEIIVLLWAGIKDITKQTPGSKNDAIRLLFTGMNDLIADIRQSGNVCSSGSVARLIQNLASVLPEIVLEMPPTADDVLKTAKKLVEIEAMRHLNHLWVNDRTAYNQYSQNIRENQELDEDLWDGIKAVAKEQLPKAFPTFFPVSPENKKINDYVASLEYMLSSEETVAVLNAFERSKIAEVPQIKAEQLARTEKRKIDPARKTLLSGSLFGKQKDKFPVQTEVKDIAGNQKENGVEVPDKSSR